MYLITVARATEEGRSGPVPLALIADTLAVSVASANEMVRKLARRGLIAYEPYRGVDLTGDGHALRLTFSCSVAALPDPTEPANLEKASGRGLLLMRTFMDEVKYNDAGNAVTLVKRRRSNHPELR